MECLDFKKASCKNCHRCLRECPVKAIEFDDHQAKIIEGKCIICGTCTLVCPQNAKYVHSEKDKVKSFFSSGALVIASVAPSFISNFKVSGFAQMQNALIAAGFSHASETAEGASAVTARYKTLLEQKTYKNFITSCCPSVNRLIEMHYPAALPYLAKVDSPMVAHAKMLKNQYGESAKIVFIGPCIAKKQEAEDSGLVDAVLTFEELGEMFDEADIDPQAFKDESETENNIARFYPISRGIIKSFTEKPDGYEYVAVDGVSRCVSVLKGIDDLSGIFLELNACEHGCVNGPCKLPEADGAVKANSDVRSYVRRAQDLLPVKDFSGDFSCSHIRRPIPDIEPSEEDITKILAKTNKYKKEDELNCGMCGYLSCREKARAVYNGYADVEMCLPYMRERAESMSFEVIKSSPNGILVLDFDLKVLEVNKKARELLGIGGYEVKGKPLAEYLNPTDFVLALSENSGIMNKRVHLDKTGKYAELSIKLLNEHRIVFGVMKDITELVSYDDKLTSVKLETLATADAVIKKQMRVAQEIASLLGETTAETKVALLNLKKTLMQENGEGK